MIYPDLGPTRGEGFVEITPFCGYAYCYQCIELTVRLYAEKLGYLSNNGRWPDIVNIPNDMIDVINKAHEIQAQIKEGSLSVNDPEAAKYLPFVDLTYTPNGGTVPPRPGDMIIYTYRKPGDHIMVVNRVGGNKVQVVQQNIWTQTQPACSHSGTPARTGGNLRALFHQQRGRLDPFTPHESPDQPTTEKEFFDPQIGSGTWRWDEDALTI